MPCYATALLMQIHAHAIQMTTTLLVGSIRVIAFASLFIPRSCFMRLVIQFKNWRCTRTIEDAVMQSQSLLECCVCFETKAHQRNPCISCGSSLPVCGQCLYSWSCAVGFVKNCLVCRSENRRCISHHGDIDMHILLETHTFQFFLLISIVKLSSLIFCYDLLMMPLPYF